MHLLRSLDDARALKAALEAGPARVVVVGCGFIGAEVAASARERGLDVTIVEAAAAPLGRVLDEAAGMAIADLHRGHGVDVRLGTGVERVVADGGSVTAVELSGGDTLPTTVVVVGIGVVPNTEWLTSSGLTLDDGVVTDVRCVAAPGVVAVGDVARWPSGRLGGRTDTGGAVGTTRSRWATTARSSSSGSPTVPYDPVAWFWSDQYDRKIQLAGVAGPVAEVVQGSIAEQRFVQLYLDSDGRPTGALCWNRPRQAILARQHLATGASADELRSALG